ncbi:hypothetical protein [Mycolicibacterium sp. 120270]|uniref:hypothetical protein n=1 Tax=Mycolicibacterium sp. 120270 TaxID=3090600 RepID=UPI000A653688|nr:hypothetical protein [Mycolicibacterium sp. 120270]MDX1887468.1 hypothetical protein [Mycolicibacterium sp. 120270]
MAFDAELEQERRDRRRPDTQAPSASTPSWITAAARSDELNGIVSSYEELWYRIHAVAPALGGALPLPWLMRTGRRLPGLAERLRRRRAGGWFVHPRDD